MKKSELKELIWNTFGNLPADRLMGLTIYGESRGENIDGRIAVGSIILERVDHRDWDGKTVHEVCLMPYQFSCYLPADPNFNDLKSIAKDYDSRLVKSPSLQECTNIAYMLYHGYMERTPIIVQTHCCQYVTTSYREAAKTGRWWDKMNRIAVIGNHEFYV